MHPMEDATNLEKRLLDKAYSAGIPINATIELTPLCNMSCEMCYVHLSMDEVKKHGGLHTVEEWISIAREMKEAGVLFVLLTGGEPLTFPGFKELYLALKNMGFILTINTNGTLLNEEWADFFSQHKPRRINITLYGDQEAYGSMCCYPDGHQKVMKAFHLLKERSVDVRIGGSVTKTNAKNLPYLFSVGDMLDIPVRVDTYIMPDIREKSETNAVSVRMTPKEAARAHLYALEHSMGTDVFTGYVLKTVEVISGSEPESRKDSFSCLAGNCSFTINWQGNMRPCVILHTPSVSVFEHGFQHAWRTMTSSCHSVKINKKCLSCRLSPLCRTCPACALLETGSYNGLPLYMCEYTEEIYRLLCIRAEQL